MYKRRLTHIDIVTIGDVYQYTDVDQIFEIKSMDYMLGCTYAEFYADLSDEYRAMCICYRPVTKTLKGNRPYDKELQIISE